MTPEVDPGAILTELGVHDAVTTTPIIWGWGDTLLWRVERHDGRAALRLFPRGREEAAEREVLAQRAAGDAGVPVPEILRQGIWEGRPALLLSWLPGQTVLDALYRDPRRARVVGLRCGRVLARVHGARPAGRLRALAHDWLSWQAPDAPLLAALRNISLRRDALLHLDYHPLNVMIHGGRISGVLDWANAALGDPRADVARALALSTLAPIPDNPDAAALLTRRRRFAHGLLLGYFGSGGPPAHWDLFLAWAGTVMVRDLAPKVGNPGVWLTPDHLQTMLVPVNRRRARLDLPLLSAP